MDVHDQGRLSVCVTGAHHHPLGDVTPIDVRCSELLDSADLPVRHLMAVTGPTSIAFAPLKDPRGLLIHNLAGENVQTIPTDAAAAELARKVLRIAMVGSTFINPQDYMLELHPARPGHYPGQGQFLWLAPGAHVVVAPREPGLTIPIRVTIFPGPRA
jgi:hypothetical protein